MAGTQNISVSEPKKVDLLFQPERLAAPKGKGAAKKLWFKGFASTEAVDQQGQRVLQDGLDLSYFLKSGWFDDGHSKLAKDGLGRPTVAEVRKLPNSDKLGLYVEGYLYDTPKNRELYDLIMAVEDAGDTGVIGFSVQGPVTAVKGARGEIIAKALVRNCAITRNAVNTETYIQAMRKSLCEMNKALDAAVNGGMVAGYPEPSYTGGGTAAPLFKQSLLSTGAHGSDKASGRKRKMKNPFSQAEWDGLTEEVRNAWLNAAQLSGCELTFEAESVMQKSLGDCTDEMVKALSDVKATLEDGGQIAQFDVAQLGAMDEAFKSHTDAVIGVRAEMAKSIEVLGNHNEMIKENGEMVKALDAKFDARIATLEASFADMMNQVMDAVRRPSMTKSVGAMDAAAVVPKPGEDLANGGTIDQIDQKEACAVIKKAFDAEVNDNKRLSLKAMYDAATFGGFKGTREQLEARIKAV